jgi:quercetin dioxygenase-like cupin family protein
MTMNFTPDELKARYIGFSGLQYSTDAFIDYRIPGCGPKKNYALIGSGVSQNPNQPVSLREKHGFQVGGVSMPAGVVNPPHLHFTAEVFICTQGKWQLHWGFNPDPSTAEFGEGDICSIPTWVYRGFKNMGDHDGFMFTALGGDDTGGILWGPQTLAAAQAQGVHLTQDYQIIDEHLGGQWSESMQRLQPMTTAEISALRTWTLQQMQQRIVRFADLQWSSHALLDSALPGCGAQMAPVIGHGMGADRNHLAPVMNAHGFSIEWLKIPAGGSVSTHALAAKQVLVCKTGCIEIIVPAQPNTAQAATKIIVNGSENGWDSYAMPADVQRSYRNAGSGDALMIIMTPGDGRKTVAWLPETVQAAAHAGYAVDANGYVALKRFTDRSQR